MILMVLGVGGVWAGRLEALAPFKWYFVAATAVLLGLGFYSVYFRSSRCAAGPQCTTCKSGRGVKVLLWTATVLAVGGLAFEQIELLLM
jgi:mercuric ion transport protein